MHHEPCLYEFSLEDSNRMFLETAYMMWTRCDVAGSMLHALQAPVVTQPYGGRYLPTDKWTKRQNQILASLDYEIMNLA